MAIYYYQIIFIHLKIANNRHLLICNFWFSHVFCIFAQNIFKISPDINDLIFLRAGTVVGTGIFYIFPMFFYFFKNVFSSDLKYFITLPCMFLLICHKVSTSAYVIFDKFDICCSNLSLINLVAIYIIMIYY